jgi:hypothetical protein
MMNLKLDTNPLDGIKEKIFHPAPKPEIAPTPIPQLPTPIFQVLPRNACDVPGCKKYRHAFPSAQALLEHARAVHRPRSAEHRSAASVEPPKPMNTEAIAAKKFKCKQCGASFDIVHQLGTHVRLSHPKSPEQRAAQAAKKMRGPAICPRCQKQFQNWRGLSSHLKWKVCQSPGQRAAGVPPTVQEKPATLDPRANFFIRFTGTKAQCGQVAMLLLENGFNNLNTGEI